MKPNGKHAGIHVGMPCYGHIAAPCMISFAMAITVTAAKGLMAGISQIRGSYIDWARNDIVREALQNDAATHLFWVDQDMMMPEDTVARLLAHEKDVVGGLYFIKAYPHEPVAYNFEPFTRNVDLSGPGLVRVGGVGHGATLVALDVYRKMADHFDDTWWYKIDAGIGEDVWFADRCREIGVECWLDRDLECGHVADVTIVRRHHEEAKTRKAEEMTTLRAGGIIKEVNYQG